MTYSTLLILLKSAGFGLLSLTAYILFIHPIFNRRALMLELTTLLPNFNWKVRHVDSANCISVLFDTVPFFLELRAGLAENGIYAYNEIGLYGIGMSNGIDFRKGQNVYKAWVEFKKFLALCKENGINVIVDKHFENDYKDFKKQIESLNNLKVLEKSAGDIA